MPKVLAFVHTMPALVDLFDRLALEVLGGETEVIHIADEILLKVVLRCGGLSPLVYRRVAEHAAAAEQAGACLVQLTCSSISPCADTAQLQVGIPVLKIDEAMVDEAVRLGRRIGVAATAPTTLKPTTDLVRLRSRAAGADVQVEPLLVAGAYEALTAGDSAGHDARVRAALTELIPRCDVVILAQASMARVAEAMPPAEQTIPVLSSPRLALERARRVLAQAA